MKILMPKEGIALLDKYRSAIIALFFLIVTNVSFAQTPTYTYQKPTVEAKSEKRLSVEGILLLPTGCGNPSALNIKDSSKQQAAFYFDSCNHRGWFYDPKRKGWDSLHIGIGGSGGATDSALYVTLTRLRDSIAVLKTSINTKADKSITLTINGTSQDISVNRTWTIPIADSSLYSTITRLKDTATALRTFINSLLGGSDTLFANTPLYWRYDTVLHRYELFLDSADATHDGQLLGTDWNKFNIKTDSINVVSDTLYEYTNGAALSRAVLNWINTLTAVGSSPNAQAATISGRSLTLQPAAVGYPGLVNTSTQGFGGFKYFPNAIGLGTITSSSTSSALMEGALNLNGFLRFILTNSSAGSNAATGFLLNNDLGHTFQFYQGSSTNSFLADGAYIRTDGTGGFRLVMDGTGHPWFKLANLGLGGSSFVGINDTAMYHTSLPTTDFLSGKTVLIYDAAHNGRFSAIPVDSLKESRSIIIRQTVGTNANITALPGTLYALPAATLSANRTIDVTALNTDRDYIEVLNNEAGFTWSFTGATVYLVDGTTTVTNLTANAFYKIRRINGKNIIIN